MTSTLQKSSSSFLYKLWHLGLLRKGSRGGRDDGILHQAYAHVATRPQLLRRRPERIALQQHAGLLKLDRHNTNSFAALQSAMPTAATHGWERKRMQVRQACEATGDSFRQRAWTFKSCGMLLSMGVGASSSTGTPWFRPCSTRCTSGHAVELSSACAALVIFQPGCKTPKLSTGSQIAHELQQCLGMSQWLGLLTTSSWPHSALSYSNSQQHCCMQLLPVNTPQCVC